MKIALASDHAGFELKQELYQRLCRRGHEVSDCGPATDGSCDYPDYARPVATLVARGECGRGVLVCGTGIGMAISANKTAGVRAANLYDATSARLSREHNDSNVATLGARLLTVEQAEELLGLWLATPFLAGRHALRVAKIEA
ncbi:MAG TPA: ribose 5-phosphate isomerase B [Terriglobales bacterium]|nr:ribose 5-phosphate isomerase B [Terriglobales bacterium]